MEAFNGEIEGTIKRLKSPYLPEVTEVRVSNTVWRIFSVQNSPLTFLQKTAFSLLKGRLAKGSLGCLFFGFSHNAGYQLQKTPWKPSLKALLALVETIGRRFSFLLQRTFSSSILARSWTRLLLLIPLFDTTSEYCKHIW